MIYFEVRERASGLRILTGESLRYYPPEPSRACRSGDIDMGIAQMEKTDAGLIRKVLFDQKVAIESIEEILSRFRFKNEGDRETAGILARANLATIHNSAESPIEILLFSTLVYVSARIRPLGLEIHRHPATKSITPAVTVTLQTPFHDFGIRVDAVAWLRHPLVIECDGFEFHSDRESFSRDRKRDRILGEEGFRVVRYSGQEIHNDPVATGLDLLDAIFPPVRMAQAI